MDHPEYEYIVHDSILDMLQLLLERWLYDVLLYARYYKTTRKCITEKSKYNESSFSNYCFIIPKPYKSLNPQSYNIFIFIWYRVISTLLKFFTFNFKHVIPRRSSTLRHKIILIKNFLCWRYDVYCCVCLCVCLIYV